MPRDLPIGNSRLMLAFDRHYTLRDLYFPHVGQENHMGGAHSRFGVWVEGRFSWIGPDWEMDKRYETDSLVTQVRLFHPELQLRLICRDAVEFHENIYLKDITVVNLLPRERLIKLFLHLDLSIAGNDVGDTAAFDPETGGMVHYKGARYFLANGMVVGGGGLSMYAAGQKGTRSREGTFRDAEDGELSGNPIAQGSVDSVIGLTLIIPGQATAAAAFWLTACQSWQEVRRLDGLVRYKQPRTLIERTAAYWRLWVRKETPPLDLVPEALASLYRRSLLVLSTQIDWQGGIVAATDSDVIQFNRDTYAYVWPRDGALVAHALDLTGYPVLARRFFDFMAKLIEAAGYWLHKYNPDGTLASSWHPWYAEGQNQLPIQEDSTALVVWALWHHFVLYRDIEFVKPLYRPLIKRAAEFMSQYREPQTGLPAPSYDLWEERRGISAFTVGAVFGGLTAASLFCTVFGEEDRAEKYRRVAAEIRDAASAHLWRPELNRFSRLLQRHRDGTLVVDPVCDASVAGLFAFGMYAADDQRLAATMSAVRERLWVDSSCPGLARYEDDYYYRVDPRTPGNPWIICTLWLAAYLLQKADSDAELQEAVNLMALVAQRALPSGVLPEQYHPHTGEPLSVSPLTWSHAAFLTTMHALLRRLAQRRACPTCGVTPLGYLRREDWIDQLYADTCSSIHGTCKL
ncbi:MAG: glycoside hydrolase family 15 protein [Desulfobacca sp.]|uniref:glycoside hydrolase family 15 protein n=1 Tax=Desulfobacca sp. TaxID=2067990 RepID=UPI00404A2AA1